MRNAIWKANLFVAALSLVRRVPRRSKRRRLRGCSPKKAITSRMISDFPTDKRFRM